MDLTENMRSMMDRVTEAADGTNNSDTASNARKAPDSTFHKLLKLVKQQGSLERGPAMAELGLSSETWGVLLILGKYDLVDDAVGEMSVGALTQKGKAVLQLLDSGKVVNIKTGEADEAAGEAHASRPDWKKVGVAPDSASAKMLKHMAANQGKTFSGAALQSAAAISSGGGRLLGNLENNGLVERPTGWTITAAGIAASEALQAILPAYNTKSDVAAVIKVAKEIMKGDRPQFARYHMNDLNNLVDTVKLLKAGPDVSLIKNGDTVVGRVIQRYTDAAQACVDQMSDPATVEARIKSDMESMERNIRKGSDYFITNQQRSTPRTIASLENVAAITGVDVSGTIDMLNTELEELMSIANSN